jgi:hypothetical protein
MPFSNLDVNNIQEVAMQMVYAFCTIVSMPVEYALRPWFGSQYFPPPLAFLSMLMMLLLPVFFGVTQSLIHLIPFVPAGPPPAHIGLGTLSEAFFLGCLLHGLRVARRMAHMETEENSRFEGDPLPFFHMLPKNSFWWIRIVWEPAFVIVLASFLGRLGTLQGIAAMYLQFAALCLAMKQFISWHRFFKFFRDILDMRHAGRIVARMLDNTAGESEMAAIHMAGFPKDVPPEMRRSAIGHMARVFSPEPSAPQE